MYYPKQIPYLLNKEFQNNIKYKEYQIPEFHHDCMCIWEMKSKKFVNDTIYNYILPDACIDIVIDFANKEICFAGFSKDTIPFKLNKQIDYMGVRLKPGAFFHLFQIPADKTMDHRIPFAEIENNYDINEIFSYSNIEDRINTLKKYLSTKINNQSENKFTDIVEQLYENPKDQNVISLAQTFGCDKRHLYRVFKITYGVSPKVLLNILRLHLCLTLLLDQQKELIDIANLCGFYDQSHFIHEIKKYTGFSPLQLIEKYQ